MNTIKVFVNIFDRAFKICLLFNSEFGYSYFVQRFILSILRIK